VGRRGRADRRLARPRKFQHRVSDPPRPGGQRLAVWRRRTAGVKSQVPRRKRWLATARRSRNHAPKQRLASRTGLKPRGRVRPRCASESGGCSHAPLPRTGAAHGSDDGWTTTRCRICGLARPLPPHRPPHPATGAPKPEPPSSPRLSRRRRFDGPGAHSWQSSAATSLRCSWAGGHAQDSRARSTRRRRRQPSQMGRPHPPGTGTPAAVVGVCGTEALVGEARIEAQSLGSYPGHGSPA